MTKHWIAVMAIIATTVATESRADDHGKKADGFAKRCAELADYLLPNTDPLTTAVVDAPRKGEEPEVAKPKPDLPGVKLMNIPRYCRVRTIVPPAIRIEIRLPEDAAWNGKYFQSGCGGMCGQPLTDYPNLFNSSLPGQDRHYATATSDTGHYGSNTDGRWGYNDPQKEEDFGYRSIGETARVAKAVIAKFYSNTKLDKSYFVGCSSGGRLAAKAALKYPTVFNGIVAGAPALDYPGLAGTFFDWLVRINADSQGKQILGAKNAGKAALVYSEMVKQCDKLDGVEDGSIADPRVCKPDLTPLACKSGDGPNCLTDAERKVIDQWRIGVRNTAGQQLYPGGVPEVSEMYWGLWLTGSPAYEKVFPKGFAEPLALDFLRYLAFQPDPGPTYKLTDFDFDKDPQRMTASAETLNADDPDLTAFRDAGGKMVMYHGWADPLVTPYKTADYYQSVTAKMGGAAEVDKFYRLFMIPGMDHCGVQAAADPGPGVDQRSIDPLTLLETWVEKGMAPEVLPMHAYAKDYETIAWSRPICRYPHKTELKDPAADWKDPKSWICK